jgi:hypothetical protein
MKYELSNLDTPLDLFQITERCEYLECILKVVNCQLSFNVMRHSDEFVEGMTMFREIEENLVKIRDITKNSRESVEFLKSKIAL